MNNARGSNQTMRALVALELKRQRKPLQRIVLAMGGCVAIGMLLNLIDAWTAALLMLVATLAPVVAGTMSAFQDKFEGTMEFLVSLPVPAATLVAGRLGAILILAVGSGVLGAIGSAIIVPEELGLSGLRVALGALLPVWLGATAFGWALVSLTIRFKVTEVFTRIAIPLLALTFLVSWLFELVFGDPLDLLRSLVDGSIGLWFFVTAYIVVCGLVMTCSWFVACSGMRRFRPEPDVMER